MSDLGLGTDLWCEDDLDPAMPEVSGVLLLAQAAHGRLITARGQLLDDGNYGTLVRDFLSAETPDLAAIPAAIEAELKKEQRIETVTTVATWDKASATLTLVITCTTALGPFTLTLAVTEISVELLATVV
jgi:hypothetical protein